MSRWRIVVTLALIAAPLFVMAGFGSYYLWKEGLTFYVGWPLSASMVLGYVLAWYWQSQKQLLPPVDFNPLLHWTDRDRRAWQLVEARAQAVVAVPPERLLEFRFYVDSAQELAQELAQFYHPNAKDPIGSLTIPEILAVAELATHDLADLVDRYLPAGHLLTIDNMRQAKQASDWYQTANKAFWLVSAAFTPVSTGLRYATSKLGMSLPWQKLQQNLIAWFYSAYVHRLGTYLIDVNSGRLKVGARRYRELVEENLAKPDTTANGEPAKTPETAKPAEEVRHVTLLLVGQVKAGKSSFVNAMLGEQRSCADVLPATNRIQRYELQPKGVPTRLVLLDSVGYAHEGSIEDSLAATEEAARQADLLLLVVHARTPARQADRVFLERLRSWFNERPDLRQPPVLAILTHIDLLSPAMEWAPPYDLSERAEPSPRLKERSIQGACQALRDQLGDHLVGIVPVCCAPGRVHGIEEAVLPALSRWLDEGRAVALLRCLRAEADTGKMRRLWQQLVASSKEAVNQVKQSYRANNQPAEPGHERNERQNPS